MAICNHIAPNGEKSTLYNALEQKYGPEKAHDYWSAIRTEQFMMHKGHDWIDDVTDDMHQHLDENGEPTIGWVEAKLKIQQSIKKEEPIAKIETVKRNLEPEDGTRLGLSNRNSEEVMIQKAKSIYDEAIANPDKQYHIDYDYRSDKHWYASGYTAKELANIFDRAGSIPDNVSFPSEMVRLINNSTARILESLNIHEPLLINADHDTVIDQVSKVLLPKRGPDGKLEGYFTSGQQQDITDSAMFATHSFLLRDPTYGANAIIKTFKGFQSMAQRDANSDFKYLHDNRVKIASDMMDQMSALGYKVSDRNRGKILEAVDRLEDMKGIDSKVIEESTNIHDTDGLENDGKEFMAAEGHGLADWGEVSFEHDPKDTASARMKMFIAMQPDMDRAIYDIKKDGIKVDRIPNDPKEIRQLAEQINRRGFYMDNPRLEAALKTTLDTAHPLLPKRNFLGSPKIVDFESTFQDILETLADSPIHSYDLYKSTLIATGRPNLINLVKSLDGADQQVRNEFSRLVSMQYTNFMMTLFNKVEDGDGTSMVLRPILSNRYSQRNTIVKNWRENQKLADIMKINGAGQRVIDVDRAREKWVPILNALQKVDWDNPKEWSEGKRLTRDILKISGVDMTDEMMKYLFNTYRPIDKNEPWKINPTNMEKLTKGTSVAGGVARQFSITQDGKPNGMFSAFIMKMAGMSDIEDINSRIDSKADIESRAEMNNPLYTENTTMQILSKVAAQFTPVLHSGTSKSSEGKDIWDYSMHTKLSHQVIDMKENWETFLARYEGVDIAKNNLLLNVIAKQPQYRDRIKLMYMDGMKPQWGKRGTTRGDMSDREQMLMSISLFQNQGNGFNSIPTVHYMSLTHSDKRTTPIMMNMPKLDVGNADFTPQEIVGKIGSAFYNVFKSEHNRIVNQKDIDFNDSRYDKGKKLFYFIPEFNKEAMQKMVSDGFLTDREFKTMWMNGENLTKQIGSSELDVVNKILNKVVSDRIENTIQSWKDNELVTDKENLFDKKYVSKLLDKNGIERKNNKTNEVGDRITTFFKNGKELTKEEVNNIAVRHAAKEYGLNYFLHNVSMSQLFYGDPAMTFKKGKTDMEAVDLTLKEYGKRLAKDIAPGLDPYFRPEDKQFNSITLKDHTQTEDYLSNLKQIFPSYKDVNATDAQEFTTVKEKLIVQYANGTIPTKTFNEMLQIAEQNKGKYYEFTNPDHVSIIMQPEKPVYSGQRAPQNGALLEDYIKTSAIPLYPPALAGLALDSLRSYMENNSIDRAPFESGKKIGSPTNPVSFFSSDGSFKEPSKDEVMKGTQRLDRNGFRIQQEVPYDEDKESIKTVSQMNKLITEGIESIKDFKVPGHDVLMSGKEVRALKETIRKNMIMSQYNDFLKDWGIDNNIIQNKSKVYDRLLSLSGNDKLTINEKLSLLSRDEEGNLHIPLQYNTAADSLESMLMSMVKDIAQVKMPGKSFVQATSAGWTFKKESSMDKSKIVWMEHYDGSPLKTTRLEDGVVKSAQVLVPFNFNDHNGNPVDVQKYMIEKDGKKILDMTRVPKELTELIGARIPNQGHSSMAVMEVVGFLPKNMGDTIVVPAGFTKQMGADFDVDKLYTYRRPYKYNQDENTFSQDQEGMSGYQTDYFNVHQAVLTHPEMVEKILKPLDKPDLKEENNILRLPRSEGYNYFDHLSQLQHFQNGKDAKMLVALTSLAVTFNSVIQDKNLFISEDRMEPNENGKLIRTTVRKYITIKDEHTGKELELTNLSGNGTSTYTREDAGTHGSDGLSIRTKADNQSTIQSAAVDNAKDRALDSLNITPDTYKAADALMQLETKDGKAANLKYATRLLTQPIIKDFAKEMRKGNDSLSSVYDPNLKDSVIERLKKGYSDEHDWNDLQFRMEEIVFDPQLLLKAQKMKEGSFEYVAHQLAALDLFEQLYDIGDRKSQLQSLFNQDTQGAGPNILTALDKSDKLTKLQQSPISGANDIYAFADLLGLENNKTLTEQGLTAAATTGVAVNILTQLLPYDKYKPVFAALTAHSGKQAMSIDNQRDVLRAIRSFNYNSGEHWWANAGADRGRLFYTREGENSLARRVEEAKRTFGKDNYFLQRLDPVIGDSTSSPDFLEYQAASVGRIDEQNNNKAWLELLMSKDMEVRKLGEDLLRYAFLTGGVQDQNSFVKFVPNSYIANTDFGNMLKEKAERVGQSDEDYSPTLDMPGFIPQFLQHYPDSAFNIGRDVFGDIPAEQNYPEAFKYDYDNGKQSNLRLDDQGNMREFVSYRSNTEGKWLLYHVNPTDSGDLYYVRVDTLGNQYTDEYDGEQNGMVRSIFTENRSLAEQIPAMSSLAMIYESLHDIHHSDSHYEELGITEGKGRKHMNEALDSISNNENVPEQLRSVASFLRGAGNIDLPGIKISLRFDSKTDAGGYTEREGQMSLNPNTTNIAQAAETVLHEYIHNRIKTIIEANGYITDWMKNFLKTYPEIKIKHEKRVEEFKKEFPELTKHVQELDKIRYEAHQILKARMSQPQIDEIERKLSNNIHSGYNKDELLYYGTKTLQEFVPHVMSDKSVQDFLKNLPQKKEGNFLQRIWKKITQAILGSSKEKSNDQLYDAMYHTVGLFGEYKQVGDITDALVHGTDIKVPTERSAKGLKAIMQYVYRKEMKEFKDRSGFTLKRAGGTGLPGPVGKITDRLKKQLDDSYKDISKGDIHQRIQARARYNDMRQDYNDAIRERNMAMITQIADKQLKWVDKVLSNNSSNPTEVQAAINTTNMWSETTEIMYGDTGGLNQTTDPTIAQLEQKATLQRIALVNKNAVKIVTNALGPEANITKEDTREKLTEIPNASAYFLTVARFKPKIISGIGTMTKLAADNRDEHMQRVHDQLTDLSNRMNKAGITAERFMQKGTWGLLDRLSNDWHTHLSELNEKREQVLDSIAKTEGLDISTRRTRQKEAWNTYWNHVKRVGTFVDTRVFFDNETGARKTDIDEHYNKLVDTVGSKDYADELIDKAHQKFQDYVEERKIQRDYLDSQIQLSNEEAVGKNPSEQETTRLGHVNNELNKWLEWNSPHRFIEKMSNPKETRFVNDGDRWVVMAPKKETGFYDPRYTELEKDQKAKGIFDEYKGLIQQMTSYLPPEHSEKLPPGFFPLVSNETVSSLSSILDKLKSWDSTLMNKITATEAQEWARIRPDEIPIMYMRENSYTKDEANRSKDLIRVAEVFSHMALHYKYMSPILDQVNVAESIIKEANRQRVSGNDEGKVLRNALDAIKYNKDKLIFNKPNELEGKIDSPIYSMKPWDQLKAQKEIKTLNEKKTEIEQEIMDKIDRGEYDYDEEQKKINTINEKLTEYEKNARYIYGSKLADTLISVNQFKSLSYNPFSALANFTFALISGHTYATGNVDYDGTHWRQGMGIMTHAMKNYYTFGAGMDSTARKIRALMERSQVMSEIANSGHGVDRNPNRIKEALNPFNWQKSGDYYAKGSMMIAMMLKHEVEATDKMTGEVKKIRLWDAMDESGKWDTNKYIDNPNWYNDDVAQQHDWNKFREKMRGVATIVFGNQDKNSPLLAKKNALGRLVGQFRMSWFPEGLNSRFGTERFDHILGRDVKGRYRSFGTLGLMTSGTIMLRSLLDMLPGIHVDRFKGLTDKDGNAIKDVDMENMRRNFTGLAWTTAIMASMVLLKGLYDDKHKGKKKDSAAMYRELLYNMLVRNQQDLQMYSSPSVWDNVTGNLIPATTVLMDTWRAIKATNHYMFVDTHKDKHAAKTWLLKITKATPILNNINKADYMFNRDLDAIQR